MRPFGANNMKPFGKRFLFIVPEDPCGNIRNNWEVLFLSEFLTNLCSMFLKNSHIQTVHIY